MAPRMTFPHSQEWFARGGGCLSVWGVCVRGYSLGGCLAPANHTVGSCDQRSCETYGLVAGSSTAVLRVTSVASTP